MRWKKKSYKNGVKHMPDYNEEVKILFKVCGPLFKDGIPLHVMLDTLSDFHNIIDKTFIGLQKDKIKITKDDRKSYYLRTSGIYNKSIESFIDIILVGYQISMPFISQFGPKGIWKISLETFEYLKTVFSAFKEGKMPQHKFINNGENMEVQIGDRIHNYNGNVYMIGQSVLPYYQSLTSKFDEPGIDQIVFKERDGENKSISVNQNDHKLFEPTSEIDEIPIKILCQIFEFNKNNKTGKANVLDGNEIPPGNYNFTIIGEQDVVPFIEAMLKQIVKITCLKESLINPVSDKKVGKLQVISVEEAS